MTPATTSDRSLPSGAYITDTSYRPLVGVSRDGQIYILDPLVTLRYTPRDGYLGIDIVRDGQVMASAVYRIEFFYTMK
jgi:hypothetical protein